MADMQVGMLSEWEPSVLDALSGPEVGRWLLDLFEGRAESSAAPPGVYSSTAILESVFVRVRGDTRLVIQRELLAHFRKLTSGRMRQAPETIEFIYAVGTLCTDSSRFHAIDELLKLVSTSTSGSSWHSELRVAALRALLDLQYHPASAAFWISQLQSHGDDVRVVVSSLEGLSRCDIPAMAEALRANSDNELFAQAFQYLRPSLNDVIAELMAEFAQGLPTTVLGMMDRDAAAGILTTSAQLRNAFFATAEAMASALGRDESATEFENLELDLRDAPDSAALELEVAEFFASVTESVND